MAIVFAVTTVQEVAMRTTIAAVAALTALVSTSVGARADGPWCSYYVQGGRNCGFYSYQQCQANISGIGGSCAPNPAYATPSNSRAR